MPAPLGVTSQGGGSPQGGALTVEQVARVLVEPLQQASVFLSTPGLQFFDTPGVPVRVPLQAPPVNPQWHGENEQISEVSPDFDEVTLLPDSMKSVKTIVRFSNELARQSVISLDAALQSRIVTDVAATIDQALIASTVTDGTQPTGLLSYQGTQTMPVGGALTLDHILDAWGLLMAAFVNPQNARLLMRSETYIALRKIKQGSQLNNYVLGPQDATQAAGPNILGIPVQICNRIAVTGATGQHATKVVLWDPSQVAVARDMAPTVRILAERYADFDQVGLRCVCRFDAAPLHPEAIVRLDGVTAP